MVWDQHTELARTAMRAATMVDRPIAGLLADLEIRGMLKDTLVIWGGEFGRTPVMEKGWPRPQPDGFTFWMAGGGVKPGFRLRRYRRLRLSCGGRPDARARLPCDRATPVGAGSYTVDLSLQRTRFSVDRCIWGSGEEDPGMRE